ncbi:hypothetical protein JYK22_07060 [Nonomuraea sp. RK-328]|nr:hypothetical protein [Nonomuraea sp. RK-328]
MKAGVDVGPTNTDAALLADDGTVLAIAKVASVPGDVVASVRAALGSLPLPNRADLSLPSRSRPATGVTGWPAAVAVGLRSTAASVTTRQGLRKVGVLRIGGAAARAVRPLSGWPEDLRAAVSAGTEIVDGGGGLGPDDWTPLDTGTVARFAARIAGTAEAVAVAGLFSPLDGDSWRPRPT